MSSDLLRQTITHRLILIQRRHHTSDRLLSLPHSSLNMTSLMSESPRTLTNPPHNTLTHRHHLSITHRPSNMMQRLSNTPHRRHPLRLRQRPHPRRQTIHNNQLLTFKAFITFEALAERRARHLTMPPGRLTGLKTPTGIAAPHTPITTRPQTACQPHRSERLDPPNKNTQPATANPSFPRNPTPPLCEHTPAYTPTTPTGRHTPHPSSHPPPHPHHHATPPKREPLPIDTMGNMRYENTSQDETRPRDR